MCGLQLQLVKEGLERSGIACIGNQFNPAIEADDLIATYARKWAESMLIPLCLLLFVYTLASVLFATATVLTAGWLSVPVVQCCLPLSSVLVACLFTADLPP